MSTWSNSEYVCVNAENLADYYNLLVYKHFNANFVALHLSVLGKKVKDGSCHQKYPLNAG